MELTFHSFIHFGTFCKNQKPKQVAYRKSQSTFPLYRPPQNTSYRVVKCAPLIEAASSCLRGGEWGCDLHTRIKWPQSHLGCLKVDSKSFTPHVCGMEGRRVKGGWVCLHRKQQRVLLLEPTADVDASDKHTIKHTHTHTHN